MTDGKGSGSPAGASSRELVLDAARAQVDDAGLESLSSRTLAARLDVTPMALYRHVEDMDEVIGVIVDRLLEDLGTPHPSPDWQSWLRNLAQAFRADLRTHPDMLALFARRPITSPAARQRLQAAIDVLGGAGFSTDEATRAYAAVHTYTIGFSALGRAGAGPRLRADPSMPRTIRRASPSGASCPRTSSSTDSGH